MARLPSEVYDVRRYTCVVCKAEVVDQGPFVGGRYRQHCGNPACEAAVIRVQTRERVRRFRERKKCATK